MSSWANLSIYAADNTLTLGAIVSETENNSHRDSVHSLVTNIKTEGTNSERHHPAATAPDDISDGVIWYDSSNAVHKSRNSSAWETLVGLTLTQTLTNKTYASPIFSGTATGTYTLGGTITITSPTINGGALSGTFSGDHTYSGVVTFSNTTDSSSTSTGAVVISGGLGVAKIIQTDAQIIAGRSVRTYFPATLNDWDYGVGSTTSRATPDGANALVTFYGFMPSVSPLKSNLECWLNEGGVGVCALAVGWDKNLHINPPDAGGTAIVAPTSMAGGIAMLNGTAASAALANGVALWAADDGASLSGFVLMGEGLTKYHIGQGGADEDVNVGGVVFTDTTEVGNVGAGEDDLMSYTMPAGLLNRDGQSMRIRAVGINDVAKSSTIKVYFGSTSTIVKTDDVGTSWNADIIITRLGATSQHMSGQAMYFLVAGTVSTPVVIGVNATETLSGAVVIKFTGENTADTTNDVAVQKTMIVELLN